MKRSLPLAGLALTAATLLAGVSSAYAQNATISANSPDILMGFRISDGSTGEGSNENLELDLGYTASGLVSAANSNGGALVLGGTNFQQDLSSTDLGNTYGANWYQRNTIALGKLEWSVFGADFNTNEFWITNPATFAESTNGTQGGIVSEMSGVYSDLAGPTSTANSNEDYIDNNASGNAGSYTNAITNQETGSNWEYTFGPTETVVGDTSAIGFWDSPVGSGNATEIGTFALSDTGVLTFSTDITPIPEPSTWAMIGFGAATLLVIRRRRVHA
jgi:hypothetical protein